MPVDVLDRGFDLRRLIDHRRGPDTSDEAVDGLVGIPAGPVVKVQERIPAEDYVRIRLLLDVGLDFICVELTVAYDFHLVGCQTVLSILQNTCSAARETQRGGGGHGGHQRKKRGFCHHILQK